MERTACECCSDGIWIRLEAGFLNSRTINSGELIRILFDFRPVYKTGAFYKNRPVHEPEAVAGLQRINFIRQN
ncbi:MAG: hypothetical protein ACLUV8_14190 [Clostridium sp.]